tara:strand:- start:1008 stop:1301 length:294 start_codon:yes stop_codon:yes gene_type:complete
MNRQQRRAAAKRAKKHGDEDLSEKMLLFHKLGDQCLTCEKAFDKTDKNMVSTWSVVVKEKEKIVRLYCPECWQEALNLVKELGEAVNERIKGKENNL